MHSNRLLIINNGIRQEGQQWGTDHAPEIDPFIANNISVLKGAASARYGSDAIAGVIVVDADPLPANNKLGGLFYALGNTNGRAGGISGQMEGAINRKQINYAWRIQGTLKKGGNYAAPAYYLKNTGYEEADYSITWGIKHHIADLKAYYSQYAAKNGIFEGAHAGNLTDLYAAFNRPVPTAPSYFSYAIDRSYQQLNHQIAKLSITKHLPDNASLEATYSFQTDKRYEYDLACPIPPTLICWHSHR